MRLTWLPFALFISVVPRPPAQAQRPDTPAPRSPGQAMALSLAGTLVPIAAGAVVLATRPQGNPATGEQADETYDVIGGVLIGLGAGVGPSLGHIYSGRIGWLIPRVLVGGTIGLIGATSDDFDTGAGLLLVGGTAVTIMAVRDILAAPGAARARNTRDAAALALVPLFTAGQARLGIGVRIPGP